jgi:methionyl-tRNA formyltransferase
MDEGDIILQRAEPIRPDDTSATLHDRLARLGAALLAETIALDPMPRQPQDHTRATYARKLTKEDGRIDWTKPPAEIERMIRAFNPWPGAFTEDAGRLVKIWRAELTPGGQLRVLEVQPAGGKRMSLDAYLRGNSSSSLACR